MQVEKEMKGRGGDIHMDGLSDQPSRFVEFHMLYGTLSVCPYVRMYVCPPSYPSTVLTPFPSSLSLPAIHSFKFF